MKTGRRYGIVYFKGSENIVNFNILKGDFVKNIENMSIIIYNSKNFFLKKRKNEIRVSDKFN